MPPAHGGGNKGPWHGWGAPCCAACSVPKEGLWEAAMLPELAWVTCVSHTHGMKLYQLVTGAPLLQQVQCLQINR